MSHDPLIDLIDFVHWRYPAARTVYLRSGAQRELLVTMPGTQRRAEIVYLPDEGQLRAGAVVLTLSEALVEIMHVFGRPQNIAGFTPQELAALSTRCGWKD